MHSSSTTPSSSAYSQQQQHANALLYGFDMPDDDDDSGDTREFLASLVASGRAPRAELDELWRLSLMRGVEEWDMLFACAEALRTARRGGDGNGEGELEVEGGSLVPFLGEVIAAGRTGEVEVPAKREEVRGRRIKGWKVKMAGKGISHFWGGDEVGEKRKVKRTAGVRQRLSPDCVAAGTVGNVGTAGTEAQPMKTRGNSQVKNDAASTPALAQSQNLYRDGEQALPDGTVAPSPNVPESHLKSERAVNAKRTSKSPFFSTPNPRPQPSPPVTATITKPRCISRPPRGTISRLPIPPLTAPRFGLIQEELADNPFRLLIAVTFLIRTHGASAIPVFHKLMAQFPTPEQLADPANTAAIVTLIRPLGLSAVRCAAIQRYARGWLERPPTRERRYGVRDYPLPGDGEGVVRAGEVFGPEDGDLDHEGNRGVGGEVDANADAKARGVGCAWEIGHLTRGPYALDSWRIFCRDVLLGRSAHWTGEGRREREDGFQPEWMRVLPRDKELRACLRWMWMREGWEWDPLTGEKQPLREELRTAVNTGRVGYDDHGNLVILDQVAGDAG